MHRLNIEASAYHEAGHAVFAWRYRNMIREGGVSIDAHGLGQCHTRWQIFPGEGAAIYKTPDCALRELVWHNYLWHAKAQATELLAGWLSEHHYHGRGHNNIPEDEIIIALEDLTELGIEGYIEDFGDLDDVAATVFTFAEVRLAERSKATLQELDKEDVGEIISYIRQMERRVKRALHHPRTWRAITSLAAALLERNHIGPEEAEAIIESAGAPRPKLPSFN